MAGQEESGEPTALPVQLISPETIQAREKVAGIIDSRQALQEEVQGMDTSVFPPQKIWVNNTAKNKSPTFEIHICMYVTGRYFLFGFVFQVILSNRLINQWWQELREERGEFQLSPEKKPQKTLRETFMDLIYMGSRKRQALLSKLGAWGPWERVEGKGRGREGAEKNIYLNKINLKI